MPAAMAAEGSLKIRLQLSAWEQAYGLRGTFSAREAEISLWLKLSAQASVLLAVFGSRREFWS